MKKKDGRITLVLYTPWRAFQESSNWSRYRSFCLVVLTTYAYFHSPSSFKVLILLAAKWPQIEDLMLLAYQWPQIKKCISSIILHTSLSMASSNCSSSVLQRKWDKYLLLGVRWTGKWRLMKMRQTYLLDALLTNGDATEKNPRIPRKIKDSHFHFNRK